MKIRTKLTILFLALSLVPFIIGGTISFYNGREALERGFGIKLSSLARNTIDKIDQDFFERLRDTKSWAAAEMMDEVLTGDLDGRIFGLLSSLNQTYADYTHIDCLDTQGEIVASSNIKLIAKKVTASPWFKKALAGKANVSKLHKDKLSKKTVVTFSAPIRASYDKSQIIGVISANLKLEGVQQLANEVMLSQGGHSEEEHIMLIDAEGLVISAPPFELEQGINSLLTEKLRSARLATEGQEGYLVERSEHGHEALIGYAHSQGHKDFPGLSWSTLVLQSTQIAFHPVIVLRNQIFVMGIGVSVVIVILSLVVSGGISRPLKLLTSSAAIIASGDLSQRVKVGSQDEIGELAASFNQMSQALQEHDQKLAASYKELELANQELHSSNYYLEYTVQEVQRLLEAAVEQKSFQVRFRNPELQKCWEVKQCDNPSCPAYENPDQRCWQIAGTFCKGEVQGKFAQKLKDCQKCEVYQKAMSSKLHAIGEIFNNMMHLLDENHQKLQDYAQNLEDRVKERTSELEEANQELKDAQAQVVQAGKLAAIGQLAAGVSHELNNPLGGILGYSQFILEKAQRKNGLENLTPKDLKSVSTYIGYIEKESQRCKTIVANLLKFSRSSKSEATPLDINQVLEETFTFTRHQLEINQVELIQELAADLPQVKGNEHQLQQVFTNLIINAQQAVKEGGTLTVSSRLRKSPRGKPTVELSFADNGCGIPKENMGKLFDPFFTTKEAGEGTGLGLSVSYGIIKTHGGKIEVESEPGKGTVFRIKLPV